MNLSDILQDTAITEPWVHGDNIPWNDPDFSKRMLREHLSDEHDMASRRVAKIDRQVAWMHEHILGGKTTRILDLACGPGLYGVRLAERGHEYVGIDFSPASIAHARGLVCENEKFTFIEGDVRTAEYGDGFGLAMMIYGEFNVFRPEDAGAILQKAHAALVPGGTLILEPHSMETVVAIGREGRIWNAEPSGLFSDRPHICLQESFWNTEANVATRRFFIIDTATGHVERYAVSYQAYSDEAYESLLKEHGFENVVFLPSLTGEKDEEATLLKVVVVRKPTRTIEIQ